MLGLIGVESALECQFISCSEDEVGLHLRILFFLLHLTVGLVPLSLDKLSHIVKGELAFLIAKAKH